MFGVRLQTLVQRISRHAQEFSCDRLVPIRTLERLGNEQSVLLLLKLLSNRGVQASADNPSANVVVPALIVTLVLVGNSILLVNHLAESIRGEYTPFVPTDSV